MEAQSTLLLVNVTSKEQYNLTEAECVIGRGWFQCRDKRISRNHAVIKITSNDSLSIKSTHLNPVFYKKSNDDEVHIVRKDNEVQLFVGDSFGLLVDEFWFDVLQSSNANDHKSTSQVSSTPDSKRQAIEDVCVSVPTKKPKEENQEDPDVQMANSLNVTEAACSNQGGGVNFEISTAANDTTVNNASSAAPENANSASRDEKIQNALESDLAAGENEEVLTGAPVCPTICAIVRETNDEIQSANDHMEDIEQTTSNSNEKVGNSGAVNANPASGDEVNQNTFEGDLVANEREINEGTSVNPEVGASTEDARGTNDESKTANDEMDGIEQSASNADENIENQEIVGEGATNQCAPSTNATSALCNDNIDANPGRPIKTEPVDTYETIPNDDHAPGPSNVTVKQEGEVTVKTEVKQEPTDESASPSRRECCRYGIRCYRRNPQHRMEEAHPGDIDYRLPDYPEAPYGAPDCPFRDRCYRRNPLHFKQFAHPPSTNPSQNRKRRKKPNKEGYEETAQLPKRARTTTNANDSDRSESEDEEEDPFASSDEDDDPDFDAEKASDDSDSNDEIDNAEEEHDEAE